MANCMTKARRSELHRIHEIVFQRFNVFCKRCRIPQRETATLQKSSTDYTVPWGTCYIEYIAYHRPYYRVMRIENNGALTQLTGKIALNKKDLYCFFNVWELSYQHYKSNGEFKQ